MIAETGSNETQIRVGVRRVGSPAPLPALPDINCVNWVGSPDADVHLLYLLLVDTSDTTIEAAFAAIAEQASTFVLLVVPGGICPDLFRSSITKRLGVLLCDQSGLELAPLMHMVGMTGLIGVDLADVISVFEQGPLQVTDVALADLPATLATVGLGSVSLAFSDDDELLTIDGAVTRVRDQVWGDLIFQAGTMIERGRCQVIIVEPPRRPIPTARDLLPETAHAKYWRIAATAKYDCCDPLAPFVGDRYGQGELPRLVICGVAGWWSELACGDTDERTAYNRAIQWSTAFALSGAKSAFWTLLDEALAIFDKPGRSRLERRRHAAWTNLSKVGMPNETAPPVGDRSLRALDAAQLRYEIRLLSPDVMLCVSGESLIPTGNAAFVGCTDSDFVPTVEGTLVKRLPNGGWLYWTGHPNRKAAGWTDGVLADLAEIRGRLAAGTIPQRG